MEKYRITAVRPKGELNHLKSQFTVYHYQQKPDKTWTWQNIGWKTIYEVSDLLKAGHEVRSGKLVTTAGKTTMQHGDAIELEMRIAHNKTDFKISEMPDK